MARLIKVYLKEALPKPVNQFMDETATNEEVASELNKLYGVSGWTHWGDANAF